MNSIIIGGYDDLTDSQLESLRSQGVDTDDWDIMILFDKSKCHIDYDEVECFNDERNHYFYQKVEVLKPKNYQVVRLIESGYSYKWYNSIIFDGQEWCLGVKHH